MITALSLWGWALVGCATSARTGGEPVSDAWTRRGDTATARPVHRETSPQGDHLPKAEQDPTREQGLTPARDRIVPTDLHDPVIATVGDHDIPRERLVSLVLKAHGLEILEELIGLEVVVAEAGRRGVTITDSDVRSEYDLALKRLTDPLSSITSGDLDRQGAERLLETVLLRRQISREVFELITRRNAYLRKLIATRPNLDAEKIRREYERLYGKRYVVRHIQLSTAAQAARIKERLAAGEAFADLAFGYSTNTASAPDGGLLAPFSTADEGIPLLFRETAARLTPGAVSDVIRIGSWYHILKLERIEPPKGIPLSSVKEKVEQALRDRVDEPAMQALYEQLLGETTIVIHEPRWAQAYQSMRNNRQRLKHAHH